jgi:hypothetical protein
MFDEDPDALVALEVFGQFQVAAAAGRLQGGLASLMV